VSRSARNASAALLALLGLGGALVAACSAFSSDDAPATTATSDASADALAETGDGGAPSACVPAPLDDVDAAAEDASCEPGSPPVDLTLSSKHCGRCGHDCLGDSCSNGRCAVTDVTSDDRGAPQISAAPDGTLFYSTANGDVRSLTPGGAPKTLAVLAVTPGAYAGGVAIGGADLFVKQSDLGIFSVPAQGGAATLLVSRGGNVVGGPAADATNLYYTDYARLIAVPRAAGGVAFDVQVSSPASVDAFGTDGAHIYWASRGPDVDGGTAPTTLKMRGVGKADTAFDRVTGLAPVRGLAFDAEYIYLVSGDGELRRVLKDGVTPPDLIGRITGLRKVAKGIAVDADHVYLACSADGNGGTVQLTLYQVSKCGGPMRVLADDLLYGGGLAASGPHLYWGHAQAVARIAK
jgi:hypothetical protein